MSTGSLNSNSIGLVQYNPSIVDDNIDINNQINLKRINKFESNLFGWDPPFPVTPSATAYKTKLQCKDKQLADDQFLKIAGLELFKWLERKI